jgi:hypothetical protein
MEDVFSARYIEHVRPFQEARKCLAVLAIADETEAGTGRSLVRDAAEWPHRQQSGRSLGA